MTFEEKFANDAGQLSMRVASLIENYGLEQAIFQEFQWNDNMVTKLFDGDVTLAEEQLLDFLALEGLQGRDDEDIDVLTEFLNEHGSGSEPAGSGQPDEGRPTPEPEQFGAGESPGAGVAAPDSPSDNLVEWRDPFGDGHGSVRVDGKQYSLMEKKKGSIRSIVSGVIDQYRLVKNLSLKEYGELLGESPSFPGNLRSMNVTLTQDRAEKWAGALGISVAELLGASLDRIEEAANISAEAERAEAERAEAERAEAERAEAERAEADTDVDFEVDHSAEAEEDTGPGQHPVEEILQDRESRRLSPDVEARAAAALRQTKRSQEARGRQEVVEQVVHGMWTQDLLSDAAKQMIIDAHFEGVEVDHQAVLDVMIKPALVGVVPKLKPLTDSPLWPLLQLMSLREVSAHYGEDD